MMATDPNLTRHLSGQRALCLRAPRGALLPGPPAVWGLLLAIAFGCSDGGGSDAPGHGPVDFGGATVSEVGGQVTLSNGALRVRLDTNAGVWSVLDAAGGVLVQAARARATWTADGTEAQATTGDPGKRTWRSEKVEDALGKGLALVLRAELDGGGPALEVRVALRGGAGYLTSTLDVRWPQAGAGPRRVTRLSPLVVEAALGGAVFVGPDAATHLVLDNGHDLYFDFDVRVRKVTGNASLGFGPGIASNWNTAVYDPKTRAGLVAGFLSHVHGAGMVIVGHTAKGAPREGGRTGLSRFEGLSHYVDGRSPIAEGESTGLTSETFYLDPHPQDVLEALERFAETYAAGIAKHTWAEVPAGWNSWGGGGGSGGLGTNIDEKLMLANLEDAASDFLPYGMKHFMLDDGWEDAEGDWNSHPTRFPDHDGQPGMAWLADRIRDKGMIPGVWISPFGVDKSSKLYKEHPEWMAEVGAIGKLTVPAEIAILDLSRPEVLDWLEALFKRIAGTWGYRWIKLDFSYYALFATGLHDPAVTPTEAYRTAMLRIREAIGPETFLLGISGTGLCFEAMDGLRVTLDNEPWWDEGSAMGAQGLRETYKALARRYYLSHRVWVNHPDLLFYRPQFGLTLTEARTFTSAVALTGGIVKLGETYTDLHAHPQWRAMVTPLLPVYPHTARPLDLFDREYPEIWHMKAAREGRKWAVVGLFNWGENGPAGSTDLADETTRTFALPWADLGLKASDKHLVFDAWAQTWAWESGAELTRALAPRDSAVLHVRREPFEPELVFTSRHLLGGAVEVSDEAWDGGVWRAKVAAVAGMPLKVWIAAPGKTVKSAQAKGGEPVAYEEKEGVVQLSLTPAKDGVELEVGLQ